LISFLKKEHIGLIGFYNPSGNLVGGGIAYGPSIGYGQTRTNTTLYGPP
jgi:hypothetical protein